MTAGAADEPLYGREHELQVVAGLVGGLATGTGGALAIRGEAGIGKSALLAAAAGLAADSNARVLSATGIQAEARLPFAALHQLLRPVLPLAEQLPPRQRAALLSAFGIADAEPAEPFLIGLATLEVISDAAASLARRCGKPGIPSTPSASPASLNERGWSCGPPGNRAAAGNRGRGIS